MKDVKPIKALVAELKRDCKYLIGLDHRAITKSEVASLGHALQQHGYRDVTIILFAGNPEESMKIIEQQDASLT